MSRIRAMACDCGGTTAIEYAVLLALIVMACVATLQLIGLWNAPVFARLTEGVSV